MADNRKMFQNGKVFKAFVLSVLRQKAADMGVTILLDEPLYESEGSDHTGTVYYDAVAPDGFGELHGPVAFELKYIAPKDSDPQGRAVSLNTKQAAADSTGVQLEKDIRTLLKHQKLIRKYDAQTVIVFITTRYYPKEYTRGMRFVNGAPVVIWDGYTVDQWCDEYPVNYSNAIGIDKVTSENFNSDIDVSDFQDKSKSNVKILQSIVKSDPKFALVLGAGISVDPGALLWNDLLNAMQTDLTANSVIDNSAQVCKKIGDSSLITAQLCRDLYKDERSFCWAIHEGLYRRRKPINHDYAIYEVARLIDNCRTKRHFRVLTYNFDNYLEDYLNDQSVAHNVLYTEDSPLDERVSIYHVHGFLPQVKNKTNMQQRHMRSIFLTEENYNDLYNHPYSWQISSQLSFFRENVCLFVGCSLADPNLRRLLEMTKADNKTHFAIIHNDLTTTKDLTVATSHFARLGVEVIWVNTFDEITDVVRSLC